MEPEMGCLEFGHTNSIDGRATYFARAMQQKMPLPVTNVSNTRRPQSQLIKSRYPTAMKQKIDFKIISDDSKFRSSHRCYPPPRRPTDVVPSTYNPYTISVSLISYQTNTNPKP